MRPRGEIRQALLNAASGLLEEQQRGGTFRELAQRACVGYEAARATVKNMCTAGELEPVERVKVPGSRKPMARYAPKQQRDNWVTGPVALGNVLAGWRS